MKSALFDCRPQVMLGLIVTSVTLPGTESLRGRRVEIIQSRKKMCRLSAREEVTGRMPRVPPVALYSRHFITDQSHVLMTRLKSLGRFAIDLHSQIYSYPYFTKRTSRQLIACTAEPVHLKTSGKAI